MARGEDDRDSLVDVSTLTSGASVAAAVVVPGSRDPRYPEAGNRDAAGRATARLGIVCETVATTTGLGGAYDFST